MCGSDVSSQPYRNNSIIITNSFTAQACEIVSWSISDGTFIGGAPGCEKSPVGIGCWFPFVPGPEFPYSVLTGEVSGIMTPDAYHDLHVQYRAPSPGQSFGKYSQGR